MNGAWKTGFCVGNSVDKIRILYFLEDRAQEGFVKALVKRIAKEESLSAAGLIHDVRSARGGSKIINEFKTFVKDFKTGGPETDLLVVVVDGNCKGHQERKKQLGRYLKSVPHLQDIVVFAVPDYVFRSIRITNPKFLQNFLKFYNR